MTSSFRKKLLCQNGDLYDGWIPLRKKLTLNFNKKMDLRKYYTCCTPQGGRVGIYLDDNISIYSMTGLSESISCCA